MFGHAEIARVFLCIGEAMSLRDSSQELRDSVFRSRGRETSRQANLAVDYLDAFAPAVVGALHPAAWPRTIVLDARTLFTRSYRAIRATGLDGEPDEVWVAEPKAGTILFALDGTSPRPHCLMRESG